MFYLERICLTLKIIKMENDKKMKTYLEHLDTELYTNYNDQDNASFGFIEKKLWTDTRYL